MFNKLLKTIRFAVLSMFWTSIFYYIARLVVKSIYGFDILNLKQWKIIAKYWNNNGVISGISDISFFIVLIIIFIVWIVGLVKINKIKYSKIMIKPLEYLANREIKKYENLDTHVVIKNISIGEKMTLEDVIKDRIKQEKTNVSKDADALRKHISQKIMQRKE